MRSGMPFVGRLRRPWAGVILVVAAAGVAAWLWRSRDANAVIDAALRPAPGTNLMQFMRPAETQAVTDRGRTIPLYHLTVLPARDEQLAGEQRFLRTSLSAGQVLRLAPPDPSYNCHGWVFAGGFYWIPAPEVPRVLEDNGYQQVSVPAEGDLVVFYERGETVHSAIVCGHTANGEPLLESKWGALGLYVHPLRHALIHGDPAFFRTSRPGGHRLELRSAPAVGSGPTAGSSPVDRGGGAG